jgi:hypothetical protein
MCMCEDIWIKLNFIMTELNLSNLVDSSFKHVLHSYGFCLVLTYKYEVGNCFFNYTFYLLDNNFPCLQLKQNNIAL